MKTNDLSVKELERLDYYDFMAYIGTRFGKLEFILVDYFFLKQLFI